MVIVKGLNNLTGIGVETLVDNDYRILAVFVNGNIVQ